MDQTADYLQPGPTTLVGPGLFLRDETQFRLGAARGTKARIVAAHISAWMDKHQGHWRLVAYDDLQGSSGVNLVRPNGSKVWVHTAGGRQGTQGVVAAAVAKAMGCGIAFYTTRGAMTPYLEAIIAHNPSCHIDHVHPGHRTVLNSVARQSADLTDSVFLPAWCDDKLAVDTVAACVGPIPVGVRRIVVPVGGGITLAGIAKAVLAMPDREISILGVSVGGDNWAKVMAKYLPARWASIVSVVPSGYEYTDRLPVEWGYGEGLDRQIVVVDPIYSSKVAQTGILQPGDLFWNSGARWWAD